MPSNCPENIGRPARGPQRRRRRDVPAPRPVARRRATAAVLAALSAEPGGATVAVIVFRVGYLVVFSQRR
jgi:hypothetical protein